MTSSSTLMQTSRLSINSCIITAEVIGPCKSPAASGCKSAFSSLRTRRKHHAQPCAASRPVGGLTVDGELQVSKISRGVALAQRTTCCERLRMSCTLQKVECSTPSRSTRSRHGGLCAMALFVSPSRRITERTLEVVALHASEAAQQAVYTPTPGRFSTVCQYNDCRWNLNVRLGHSKHLV